MVAQYEWSSCLKSECRKGCLDLTDLALLQALLYLPSLEIWRVRSVCGKWNSASSSQESGSQFWNFETEHPFGLVAKEAVWLHTITALPRLPEALKLLQGCFLIGASWLCAVGMERLLSALQQIDKPWNLTRRPLASRNIVKSWSFGLPWQGGQPAAALCDFLQLGDLLALNGRWIGHIRSKPLKVTAHGMCLFAYLTVSFHHGGESMLRWTASCSKDMFENDVEVELCGRLVSPCHADIAPFGMCDQNSNTFVVDDSRYDTILQALSCGHDFVCVLHFAFRHLGEDCVAFTVSTHDEDGTALIIE